VLNRYDRMGRKWSASSWRGRGRRGSASVRSSGFLVGNVVRRIDEVVRGVRFESWQDTIRGDVSVHRAT
jgi:hypothetical protein